MALQFRTGDSATWAPKYGNGSAGSVALNTTTFVPTNTTFSGSNGATSGTLGNASGFSAGLCVLIVQIQYGTVGGWQLNFITDINGTNVTFLYQLQQSYGSHGQIYVLHQYRHFVVNSGQTVYGPSWNGSAKVGGVLPVFASEKIQIDGALNMTGRGYRGGIPGMSQNCAGAGESIANEDTNRTSSAQYGGGGGGDANRGYDAGHAGGGGGHASSGQSGTGHNDGNDGAGGGTYGTADLSTIFMGSGGGGNGMDTDLVPITGSPGGGIVMLFAPSIVINGSVWVNGNDASQSGYANGGAGSAGSILLKGDTISAASLRADGGARSPSGGWNALGGYGGYGRLAVYYTTSYAVTSTNGVPINYYSDTALKAPLKTILGSSF